MATPAPESPAYGSVVATLRAAGCVFAEDEARLLLDAARSPADLAAMVQRRVTGLPLEQILGWVDFAGLRIVLERGVFVPRRRTQFLAQEAIRAAQDANSQSPHTDGAGGRPAPVVVELCCGCGAVGAALIAALPGIELSAVDIDADAVRCARRNLGQAQVYQGDLYAPLPATLRGWVDVVVANAPYVPTGDLGLMPPEARLYEPRVSLDGGTDGLDVLRRVIAGAPDWLVAGGQVLVETSPRQAPALVEEVQRAGLRPEVCDGPEFGATVVTGVRPAAVTRPTVPGAESAPR